MRTTEKNKHSYVIFFALLFLAHNYVVTASLNPLRLSDVCYPYFLVDFSMGFCSKLLPGAIYNFLFDNTSRVAVFSYNTFIFIAFVLVVFVMLEKLILRVGYDDRKNFFCMSILFLTGISVFPMCVYKMGSLDSYWIYFTILSVVFLSDRRLYLLIIPSSLMVIMVNFGGIFVYIPFIILLTIYKSTVIQEKSEKYYLCVVAAITTVLSILLSGYFVIYEQGNLVYTFEEFTQILNNRGYDGVSRYYATGLYSEPYYDTVDYAGINGIESPIYRALYFVFQRFLLTLKMTAFEKGVLPFLVSSPTVVVVIYCFNKFIKCHGISGLKKFVLFCMSAMFFMSIAICIIFSSDVVRFIGHAYSLLIASFFYVVYYERENISGILTALIKKIPKAVVFLYYLMYVFLVFDPEG